MNFKEGWKEYKLGEVVNIQNGFAFKAKDFEEKGVPVIKIKNILSPRIEFHDVQFFNGELNVKLKPYVIRKGDILISMTGSHLNQISSAVGKMGRYQHDYPALLNQRVGKIYITDADNANEDFIFYYLNRFEIQYDLVGSAGGSANQANISPTQIKNLKITIPPLATQRRIAEILSSLDEKIELNRQMNQTLEETAQTLFREMCLPKGEELPEGWEWKIVGELVNVNKNSLKKDNDFTEIQYIDTSSVTNNDFEEPSVLSKENAPSRAKRLVKHQDIIYSTVRPIQKHFGIFYYPKKNTVVSTGFAVISPKKKNNHFIYCFLSQDIVVEYLNTIAESSTSTFPAFRPNALQDLKIALPDEKSLFEFEQQASLLFDRIYTNSQEIATLTQLRDCLLPKLMNGEVEVENVKIETE